jgi:hypothetical protein
VQAVVGERGRVDAARQFSQLRSGGVQAGGHLREPRAGVVEQFGDVCEASLGAVTKLALELTALLVGGLDQAPAGCIDLRDAGADLGLQAGVGHGEAGGRGDVRDHVGCVEHGGIVDQRGQRAAAVVNQADRVPLLIRRQCERPAVLVDIPVLV